MPNASLVFPPRDTLPMSVANMSFMVDRLGADCAPLQYIRELTQNAVESIMRSPDSKGEIHWDVDWNRYLLTGIFKLAVIDNGTGMSGPDMLDYINKLSSSIHEQSKEGNFGIGAKIAAAPKNPAGLVYLSWINGVGSMIHLWKNPDTGVYGLRKFERPDGSAEYWAPVVDDIKPPLIKDHGTMVILLGKDDTENTVAAAAGTPMPSRWVLRYLNTRYARFPKGIVVKSREGWDLPKGDSHNFLRTITGQVPWLNQNSCKSGEVSLTNAVARWYILKPNLDQNSGHLIEGGHMAALYQDELYEMATSRMGVGRLQSFGVIFGHNRVVIYVEPTYEAGQMTPNTARTNLLIDGESLPWADWAAEFREKMPQEIKDLMEEVSAGTETSDHRQSILERLKQIRDLFRFSRYRPASNGKVAIDPETVTIGGKPSESENHRGKSDTAKSGGTGGRAGDIYALFLAAKGIPGEEFQNTQQPDTRWISVAEGTRIQPDLEDRAAKFLPQQNLLLINADFRVFLDMIDRWCKKYSHAPGARPVVEQVVREWFEQQLVEAVLGALAIRGSSQWTLQDTEKLWNEEALTAVILPRYHVDNSIKRALGSKLGSIKELVPSA